MKDSHKSATILRSLFTGASVLAIGGAAYYFYSQRKEHKQEMDQTFQNILELLETEAWSRCM